MVERLLHEIAERDGAFALDAGAEMLDEGRFHAQYFMGTNRQDAKRGKEKGHRLYYFPLGDLGVLAVSSFPGS